MNHSTLGPVLLAKLPSNNTSALSCEGYAMLKLKMGEAPSESDSKKEDQSTLDFMEWSDQQDIDPNNPHRQRSADTTSVVLNDRFYLF